MNHLRIKQRSGSKAAIAHLDKENPPGNPNLGRGDGPSEAVALPKVRERVGKVCYGLRDLLVRGGCCRACRLP